MSSRAKKKFIVIDSDDEAEAGASPLGGVTNNLSNPSTSSSSSALKTPSRVAGQPTPSKTVSRAPSRLNLKEAASTSSIPAVPALPRPWLPSIDKDGAKRVAPKTMSPARPETVVEAVKLARRNQTDITIPPSPPVHFYFPFGGHSLYFDVGILKAASPVITDMLESGFQESQTGASSQSEKGKAKEVDLRASPDFDEVEKPEYVDDLDLDEEDQNFVGLGDKPTVAIHTSRLRNTLSKHSNFFSSTYFPVLSSFPPSTSIPPLLPLQPVLNPCTVFVISSKYSHFNKLLSTFISPNSVKKISSKKYLV